MESYKKKNAYDYTDEDWLKEMIESVWTYYNYSTLDGYYNDRYLLERKEKMSTAKWKKIIKEYVEYLNENYEVHYNTGTDSEGYTYNSMVKKEGK